MVKGITPDNIDILHDLNISYRLKARVGVLLTSRISITPGVLETAEKGSEAESFLLSSALLKGCSTLTEKKFEKLLSEYSDEVNAVIVFQENKKGYSVIMLSDEKIAGDILDSSPGKDSALPVVRGGRHEITRRLTEEEEKMYNDPDSLKMTILTSPDTQVKIEAIRRMLFLDFDIVEKGNLFFAALSDEDSIVRTEALKAMNKIGLDADLADSMQVFCNAAPTMMSASIKRLAGILQKVTVPETVIGAKILVSRLKDDVSLENKNAVIVTLAGVVEKIIEDRAAAREISEQVLRVFIREPEKLEIGINDFFNKVLPFEDNEIHDMLYKEQFRIDDVRISSVIASLLFKYEKSKKKRQQIVENVLKNFNEVADSETGKRRVLNALAVIDDDIVYELIIKHFNSYSPEVKSSILYYLGSAVRRGKVSGKMVNAIADVALNIVRIEDNKLIIVLLETAIFANPKINKARRRTIVGELIRLWKVFTIPYLQYALEDTLLGLGVEAVEIIFEYLKDFPDSSINEKLSPIIGENISKMRDEKTGANKRIFYVCIDEGIKLFRTDFPAKGVLAEMLGRAAVSPLMKRSKALEIYRLFMENTDYVKHRNKILDGLGWLGSSSKIDLKTKIELAARFERFLSMKLPDVKEKKFVKDNMNVFVLGPEADIYTDFLPVVIRGIARVGVSVRTESSLQLSILKAILRLWQKTASWETILGPAASAELVKALGSIGSIKDISIGTKKLILKSLLQWKNHLYVISAVGCMAQNGKEKYQLSQLFGEVLNEILDMLTKENDAYSEKEKMIILECYANIINNKRIDPRHKHYNRFIDEGIKYLVRGYKEGVRRAYDWLELLSENTDIPKKFINEAKEILKTLKMTALEIYGPGG